MSDIKEREIARRALTGDPQAQATLLQRRMRTGELTANRVHLAAYLGHQPAREVLGWTESTLDVKRCEFDLSLADTVAHVVNSIHGSEPWPGKKQRCSDTWSACADGKVPPEFCVNEGDYDCPRCCGTGYVTVSADDRPIHEMVLIKAGLAVGRQAVADNTDDRFFSVSVLEAVRAYVQEPNADTRGKVHLTVLSRPPTESHDLRQGLRKLCHAVVIPYMFGTPNDPDPWVAALTARVEAALSNVFIRFKNVPGMGEHTVRTTMRNLIVAWALGDEGE